MVLSAQPVAAVGALAFGGANGQQVGTDWQLRKQPNVAAGGQHGGAVAGSGRQHRLGPGSPYARPPKGVGRRRKGKADSWGTRPIDLFWNERASEERAQSPGSARGESTDLELAGNWSTSGHAPDDEAIRRAALRLESSTGPALSLRVGLPELGDGRASSAPPAQQEGSPLRPAAPPARYLASPALAAQSSMGADAASLQRKAAMMKLPWRELPVSAASYPANGMQLKRAATKATGKQAKAKAKKALPHKTMQWLASRHRMGAAETVQPELDKILRGDSPPKEPVPPNEKKKRKKRKKSRAARARAKERALKRQQALEMQQAINGGVEAEVKRWKESEKVRGKEMVSREKYLAWYAKWTDGGKPTEQEWQEFFGADTDGDGVLSHAELAEFAERKGRGVSAERADFWKMVTVVGTRVQVKGQLGVVIKGPDEDDDVTIMWDKDDSETFVKKIELRLENMADANHFFYNPDAELEYIQHNQAALARKRVADLEAAHAAQLEEAERARLEAEEAERVTAEQEAGWGSDDEENEFASYVHSLHKASTPDLAGWAALDSHSPRAALHGSHSDRASWRASLDQPGGYTAGKPRRPGPGASFELSLSYAAVAADHMEMEKEDSLDPIEAVSNVLKTTNKNHIGADPQARIPLSKNDVSISRHPAESPTKQVLDHLKRSGVPKSARQKLREALNDFDKENPPAQKLADWRLAVPAEGRDSTSVDTRPPVVMDPQARHLLMELTPKPQYRSQAERSRRRLELRQKRRPAERLQQQTIFSELSVSAGGNEGWADSLRQERPQVDPLTGDDARSVFALRQSGRYRVGAVGHVQWQRGWYSVVIEEVAQNAPKVRISYLPPYNAYTTDDDWKHFWEVHFDEEAAKGAEATRTASAQRVAMYRQVKLEKEEQAAEEAQCREFARQWIVSGMLSNPIRGALARGYHSGVPERPPTPRQDKNKPWMNIYARPLSAEQRPEAGLAAATRVARPWTPLPKAPPPPEPEPEEEPWLDEERAALMANVSVHGAKNWVQRAYELGTYRTPEEVERAWTKFDEEERELAQLRAKLEAEAEARQLALDAEEAQRRVEEAQALQLYDEAALYTEQGDFKHAYEALVPASALAPNHTGIAAALDRATEKYEEWLAKTEELRRKQQEAKERREKALKLSATKASHPMQWAVFRQIDTSGDGLLQADEVRAYMTELGQPEMATQLLDALDRDGDGDIDFPEFCAGWERWLANNSVGTNDHLAGS